MKTFKELLEELTEAGCTCWSGYKRVPGTKPCASKSCVKKRKKNFQNMQLILKVIKVQKVD